MTSSTVTGVFCQSGTREAWWPLTPQLHLASGQPGSEPLPGTYISFAPQDDQCLLMDKAQRVLVRDLISDIGEPVFAQRYQPAQNSGVGGATVNADSVVVRRIKSPWLYATTQARLNNFPANVQLISGLAALRGLLATSPSLHTLQAPFVTGVLFQGDTTQAQGPGHVQVLVLMVCSETGELSQMDYVPLAGLDPASAIRSFVQSVRLSSSGEWTQERTAIFTADEILRLGSALRPYPRESEVLGIAVSKLWRMGSVASMGALACTGTALAALTYLNHSATAQSQQNQIQLQVQQQALTQMLATDRLAAVLERRSVKPEDAIGKASAVWQEGAKVVIAATPDTLKLTVSHKVQASDQSPDQTPQALAKALSITPPEGCTRVPPSITPQISELYLTYECQTSDTDLQRLGFAGR
ncbi:hypothetical protein [Limnohabitans sp.]|uniref:hypothetical protein n=1 Tax=Limnohabitans sp. TaxID=1907725 RepID=UPI00289E0CAD|nr:hypothetical protein [Limnohabitans sp.]